MTLSGKKIILGITGSIAAYKSVYFLRRLVEEGADVTVVMTEAAKRFVSPLPLQVFSGKKVYTEMFNPGADGEILHLYHGRYADVITVVPATANIIGKMASGIGDDLLSSILIAARCPVVMAPAMDSEMYENPIVKRNISSLKKLGVHFLGPTVGPLASGSTGIGRMVEPEDIVLFLKDGLSGVKDLDDQVIIITAGPTREAIDPVRYISNRSSGKMGYELARAAQRRGARVILISGPTSLSPPAGVECIRVISAEEMFNALMDRLSEATVVIMAAAVADFKPEKNYQSKLSKEEIQHINLVRTPDILKEISRKGKRLILAGFAADTGNVIEKGKGKLDSKGLDMIVVNDISLPGAGFEGDTNVATILDRWGGMVEYPLMKKSDLAEKILDHVRKVMNYKDENR